VEWWGPGRPAFRSPRGWIEFEGGWRERGKGGRKSEGKNSEGRSDVAAATSEGASGEEIADLGTALIQANEALGVRPDGWTPSARWKREVDIPDGVLGRAGEAILEGMEGERPISPANIS
jgi:hypothetical protein